MKMILHFSVSDFISTYRKLNVLLINGIHLVVSSLVMQMRLIQTKVYYKLAAAKKVFSKGLYHWYNLLRWMLFAPCDNRKTFFYTNLSSLSGLVQPPCCCVLWSKYFEWSRHFISVISTITLQCCNIKGLK